jgi:hypothetical protein
MSQAAKELAAYNEYCKKQEQHELTAIMSETVHPSPAPSHLFFLIRD